MAQCDSQDVTHISEPQESTVERAEAVIVRLPAELDMDTEDAATADLAAAMATGRPVVVVDLTDTTFTDSRGARMLYCADREGASRGIEVRFAVSHRSVLRTLEILGYTRVLTIYASRAAAIAAKPAPRA